MSDALFDHYKEIKEANYRVDYIEADGKKSPEDSKGKIAEINFSGMMTLEDTMCSYGTRSYAKQLYGLYNDDGVKAILLNMNTGGGHVDAASEFYNAIAVANKPVFVHSHLLASGGIMGTLPATQIHAAHNLSDFGSIGTFISINRDIVEYLKKNIDIYATKSTEKNIEVRELLKDNLKPFIKRVDNINEEFISMVNKHKMLDYDSETTLKGGMFKAQEAKKRGLIDGISNRKELLSIINQTIKVY